MTLDTIQSVAQNQGVTLREASPTATRRASAEGGMIPVAASVPVASSGAEATDQEATRPAVEKAVQLLSDFVSSIRPEINFSIDEASGMHVVKIIDSQSNQVIRQIPSEEAVRLAQALDKLQGLFVKDKA